MTPQQETPPKTYWHRLFGALLESFLTPVGVEVLTDFPVMQTPPEADIVLLRRDRPTWTAEQQAVLPDGIRDRMAGHVILEFKYTQSLTEQTFRQAIGYDYFYRESRLLKASEVQTAVVSAKTPQRGTLRRFGYTTILKPGVYQSKLPVLDRILLIVSNQLEDTVYNAPVKCFASRNSEKRRAFTLLQRCEVNAFSQRFWWIVNGLWEQWFMIGGNDMQIELTPEQVAEMGKMWGKHFLAHLPIEERLAGLKPEERLAGLKPEERLTGLKLEERLAGLKLEERLTGLKPEEIEAYLRKIKASSSHPPSDIR